MDGTIREQLDAHVKQKHGIDPEIHISVMMFAMGYPSDKTKPSPWHFQRKPIEETVTML